MQPYLRPDDEPTVRMGPSAVSNGFSRGLNTLLAVETGHRGRWLEPGDLLAGRYRIEERIGSGGMGVVYRAYDEQLRLCVAVKVLRPDLAGNKRLEARLRRELVLARQVSHRNAVRIYDLGQDGGLLFLTMDFVDGRSLRDVLAEEGPFTPERAAALARQLALALEAAHEEGIVHRDLKPANVLVDDSGRAWITDFGVARSLHDPGFTRPGAVVGTLAYLSPEQARGGEVDGRGDLYALGILLFEMLTGELPFPGSGSDAEAMAQRRSGASRDLRTLRNDVPSWLAAIVRRLLQHDANLRFQSAREVIDALDGIDHLPRLPLRQVAAFLVLTVLLTAGWTFTRREGASQAAVVPPPAAPVHTVAVLPLVDETGRPDLAWMSRGLAEMIANDLGESPALRVVDSARVFQTVHDLGMKEPLSRGDRRRLSELLDADRLVTGHIWAAGGHLRAVLRVSGSEDGFAAGVVHTEKESKRRTFAMTKALSRELHDRLAAEPHNE